MTRVLVTRYIKPHTYLKGKTDPGSVTYEYPSYPLGYCHTLSEDSVYTFRSLFSHSVVYSNKYFKFYS